LKTTKTDANVERKKAPKISENKIDSIGGKTKPFNHKKLLPKLMALNTHRRGPKIWFNSIATGYIDLIVELGRTKNKLPPAIRNTKHISRR